MQLLRQVYAGNRLNGIFFPAILSIFRRQSSQNHFRMLRKIAVQPESFLRKSQAHPLRFHINGMFPLLKKNNV